MAQLADKGDMMIERVAEYPTSALYWEINGQYGDRISVTVRKDRTWTLLYGQHVWQGSYQVVWFGIFEAFIDGAGADMPVAVFVCLHTAVRDYMGWPAVEAAA